MGHQRTVESLSCQSEDVSQRIGLVWGLAESFLLKSSQSCVLIITACAETVNPPQGAWEGGNSQENRKRDPQRWQRKTHWSYMAHFLPRWIPLIRVALGTDGSNWKRMGKGFVDGNNFLILLSLSLSNAIRNCNRNNRDSQTRDYLLNKLLFSKAAEWQLNDNCRGGRTQG